MSVPAVPSEAVEAFDLTKLDAAAWAIVSSPNAPEELRFRAARLWWPAQRTPQLARRAWFQLRALAATITPVRMVAGGQPRSGPRRRGAGRPAGKRGAPRGGDSGDDGPLDPSWPRRVAAHVALDLRAGRSRRALDRLTVALAMAIDGAGLAVTPKGVTP